MYLYSLSILKSLMASLSVMSFISDYHFFKSIHFLYIEYQRNKIKPVLLKRGSFYVCFHTAYQEVVFVKIIP
jgi:hypothetical protein